jgi:hypothetical protein
VDKSFQHSLDAILVAVWCHLSGVQGAILVHAFQKYDEILFWFD